MKKKLPVVTRDERTMLPEVLPDPRAARARSTAPRQRTIAHMQRMLTMGAAVGLAFGCGKTTKPAEAGGESRGCGKGSATNDDAGANNVTTSTGYAVVDPVPTPAYCPNLAQKIHATALAVESDAGDLLVDVYFPLVGDRPDVKYVADATPVAYAATVVQTWHQKGGVTVRVKPQGDTQNASVSVKIMCDHGPGTISANLSMPKRPKPGQGVAVYVSEY